MSDDIDYVGPIVELRYVPRVHAGNLVLQYRRQHTLLDKYSGYLSYEWSEWTDVPVVSETMGS